MKPVHQTEGLSVLRYCCLKIEIDRLIFGILDVRSTLSCSSEKGHNPLKSYLLDVLVAKNFGLSPCSPSTHERNIRYSDNSHITASCSFFFEQQISIFHITGQIIFSILLPLVIVYRAKFGYPFAASYSKSSSLPKNVNPNSSPICLIDIGLQNVYSLVSNK